MTEVFSITGGADPCGRTSHNPARFIPISLSRFRAAILGYLSVANSCKLPRLLECIHNGFELVLFCLRCVVGRRCNPRRYRQDQPHLETLVKLPVKPGIT